MTGSGSISAICHRIFFFFFSRFRYISAVLHSVKICGGHFRESVKNRFRKVSAINLSVSREREKEFLGDRTSRV